MEKFARSVFTSFTVWVSAALINAALVGVWSLFVNHYSGEFLSVFGMVVVCTLLLSIPGMFIFWIFFISNYREEGLFQQLLQTAMFISFFSALTFFGWTGKSFRGETWWLGMFTVVASITSVMIHHSAVKSIVNKNKNKTDV